MDDKGMLPPGSRLVCLSIPHQSGEVSQEEEKEEEEEEEKVVESYMQE